jgi:hypothetical protein
MDDEKDGLCIASLSRSFARARGLPPPSQVQPTFSKNAVLFIHTEPFKKSRPAFLHTLPGYS